MGLFDSMLESHERIKKHAATTRAVWGIVSDAKEITRLVGQIKEESRITKIRVPLSSEECLGKKYEYIKRQFEEAGFSNFNLLSANDMGSLEAWSIMMEKGIRSGRLEEAYSVS